MKKLLFIGVCLLFFFSLYGQGRLSEQIGNVKEVKVTNTQIDIIANNAKMTIQAFSPEIIRIRVTKTEFVKDFSYAVILPPQGQLSKISEDAKTAIFTTSKVKLIIKKQPLRLEFYNESGVLLNADDDNLGISWMGTEVTNYKKLFNDEKIIGLGEKTGGLNRRGNVYEHWNSDAYGYGINQDPLYSTIPFYIGIHNKQAYGIFLDNSYRTFFNFGVSNDESMTSFGAPDGELNYYFIAGSNVAGIVKNYTDLTGKAQLPPLWSLGYQQSRYSYYPDTQLIKIATTFREKKIPVDVFYLDIHYMDSFKIFTFHPKYYPNPAQTIAELKKMGMHTVVICDPGLKIEKGYKPYEEGVANNYLVKYPNGSDYIGSVWPGRCHFPDFTNPSTRTWWGGLFKTYTDVGIDGIWNDMNEPSAWGQKIPNLVEFNYEGMKTTMSQAHNIYGMQMARSTFEGASKLLPNTRMLNITRATYSGGQRYSTIWTGDNDSYDAHMLLGVRLVNSLGICGFPFAGPDIGGFTGEPSADLITRWLSIGIYTPFLRNHAAVNRQFREPWVYGEKYEVIARNLINWRYQMLPYLYSAAYEATQSGLPVNRTLAINYTFDENIYKHSYENEFLFGDNLLVVPVTSDLKQTKVYLPAGNWYRLSTDQTYDGEKEITAECPLIDLPVYVKAGAIIPMQSIIQSTSEANDGIMYLHVYYGKESSSFKYYEDDGVSYNFKNGQYYERFIAFEPDIKSIVFAKKEGTFASHFSKVRLIFHGFPNLPKVTVNMESIAISKEDNKQIIEFGLKDIKQTLKW